MLQTTSLQVFVAFVLLLWVVAIAVYRITFHPLAKYPGPFLAKITSWAVYSEVSAGRNYIHLQHLHKQYGHVVRTGPDTLSYNTVEALQAIYADRKANVVKSGWTETIAFLKGGRNLQTITDKHAYLPRRRLINHAFSEEALRSSQPFLLEKIDLWCEKFGSMIGPSGWSSDINLKDWTSFLEIDILGELCFGESFGACEKGDAPYAKIIEEGVMQIQKLAYLPGIERLNVILKYLLELAKSRRWEPVRASMEYDEAIESMIARRMDVTGTDRKDFFHYIMQAKDSETGEQLDRLSLNLEAGVLFGAGVDTSAASLSATIHYLLQYPDVMAKLKDEIRTTFSSVDEIVQGPKLQSLHYLRACIDESLRISPPVPGPLVRKVEKGGIVLDNKFVPAGTEVYVPCYAIHHNEEYYPDPWAFRPERWLSSSQSDSDDAQLKLAREAFHAFSAGTRLCVGRSLAYLNMTLTLARLLFLFDIRRVPGSTLGDATFETGRGDLTEYHMTDWFVTGRDGPLVQLKRRTL